ncbi:diguanylate cyclase [Granulosicoccaceae sp. 1_MG-2023]|nr:diguanylate cyclase [Granulosicoccaceae sp. 1_MG-2023]
MLSHSRLSAVLLAAVLLLLSLSPASGAVEQPATVEITRALAPDAVDLTPFTSYVEDPKGILSAEDLLRSDDFTPVEGVPNFGFTDSAYWFRVPLSNHSDKDVQRLLEVSYALLQRIDVYLFRDQQLLSHHQSGLSYPGEALEFNYRHPVIPLTLPRDADYTLLLRVKTDSSVQVHLRLWTNQAFAEVAGFEQFIFGLYYGAMLALLAYNLLLTPWLRDSVYVYYVGYLAFFALFQLNINGYAPQFLWPHARDFGLYVLPPLICTAAFLAHRFSIGLLEVEKRLPDQWPAMQILARVMLASAFITALLPYPVAINVAISTVLAMLYYFYLAVLALKAGVTVARYYLLAWTTFLLGAGIYALKSQGLIPSNAITEHMLQVGSVMEVLLLSFAMANRFRKLEEENKRISTEANQNLEVRVEERTRELKNVLEELSVANARLESLNNTDTLTGVNNRAFFESHFEYVWNNTLRANESISIMMIDVDHFKPINDTYGHLIGDEVLISVAQTIKKSLSRNTDQMARYGGEEFVVVLPSTRIEGAAVVAERIRLNVSEVNTSMFGLMDSVTVSIGVASVAPGQTLLSPRELIDQADRALYHAKNTGRNQVATFDAAAGSAEETKRNHAA